MVLLPQARNVVGVAEEKKPGARAPALAQLFSPRSVALIGISADPHKLNGIPLRHLRRHKFAGPIYPINPKYNEIDGIRCYSSILDVPGDVEVAMIMVAAPSVPKAVADCGKKGVAAAVILSSGFEEAENGAELVRQLKEAASIGNVDIVGPNCEGVWSIPHNTILTFGSAADRDHLTKAPVAIVSQSGSIGGCIVRHLQDSGFGCSYFVSVGNETTLDCVDYLEYLVEQDDVRVVLLFIEALKDGQRLIDVASRARARGVSLVALKSGSSKAGLAATASHTGKIATSHRVYGDIFTQCGIIQVGSLSDLLEAAEVLSSLPRPLDAGKPSAGVAVFSIPGGTRALTADACEQRDVPLAVFEENTVQQLKNRLPQFGYARNPTDLTAQVLTDPSIFNDCLNLIADDPNSEAIIVQLANRGPRDARRWKPALAAAAKRRGQPLILSFLGDVFPPEERRAFASEGMFCARDPADAVKYLDWLYRARAAENQRDPSTGTGGGHTTLPPVDDIAGWSRLLASIGISTPKTSIVGPDDDLQHACGRLRFPVVAKAMPSVADHKTELGLVRLNLRNSEEVGTAVTALRQKLGPSASVILQEMISGGVEAVVSMTRNADFGPVLAIGSGGAAVEVFKDVAFLGLPVSVEQVERAVRQLKLNTLLDAFRGREAADVSAFCRAALELAAVFAGAQPAISEIEFNPLIVLPQGQGIYAVDIVVKG